MISGGLLKSFLLLSFCFPTLAQQSQRGDYLWGQHRIREKQGSSGDFAKNDHNNDVDDDDEAAA